MFPAFLQKLPLRDDYQENEAVVNCFYSLYQQGNSMLKQHLADVIKILVHIYYKGQTPNEGKWTFNSLILSSHCK